MLSDLLGSIWRRTPMKLKQWAMRYTNPRFAVTSGAIINDRQDRVLLLKHRFRPGAGWGIPGGYIKAGEQPDEAVQRELREEIGLELDHIKLFKTRVFKEPQQVEIIFLCQASGELGQLNYEIEKAEWFRVSELPPELPKDQAELIQLAFSDGATEPD